MLNNNENLRNYKLLNFNIQFNSKRKIPKEREKSEEKNYLEVNKYQSRDTKII